METGKYRYSMKFEIDALLVPFDVYNYFNKYNGKPHYSLYD